MDMRVKKRADRGLRQVEWLLSRRDLQQSTRRKLTDIRRQLQHIRDDPDEGSLGAKALQWAMLVATVLEVLQKLL